MSTTFSNVKLNSANQSFQEQVELENRENSVKPNQVQPTSERVQAQKTVKDKIIESTKVSLEGSSIHGIPNIIRTRYDALKVFGFVCFLLSSSTCAWYLLTAIQHFLRYEKITNIDVKNVNQLPFPVISICKRSLNKEGFNKSGDLKEVITDCHFVNKECDYENDFEYYEDINYKTCVRYNSGRSKNGTLMPFKFVNNKGDEAGLNLFLFADLSLRIWITNETVEFGQNSGEMILSGSVKHELKISKHTLIKQEQPHSDCLNGLDTIDSYDSEVFKRTLKASRERYHYSNCFNLCKQKNLGEKCQLQVIWWGPKYFANMFAEPDYNSLINGEHNQSKCFKSNSNPTEEYLEKCDCPIECQSDEYTYVHSTGDIFNTKYKNKKNLFIFYDEMRETVISEEKKTEITDLVATVGGILGLFTGFSFLSLVEIFEIIFQIAMILLKRDV